MKTTTIPTWCATWFVFAGLLASAARAQAPFTIPVVGESLASVRDVDGDGRRDLVIGVPSQGLVRLYSGWNGTQVGTLSAGLGGSSRFGAAVANIGDLDHDGFDDVLIGAPRAGLGGRAYVFSTRTFAQLRRWSPFQAQAPVCPATADRYGHAVCKIGDLDGNGVTEVAIGDPHWSVSAATCSAEGLVEIVDIHSNPPVLLSSLTGAGLVATGSGPCTMNAVGPGFGFALTGIADLDDDGAPELVVGAPGANQAFAYSGTSLLPGSGPSLASTINGFGSQALGTALAQIGDLDQDGRRELAVGAPAFGPFGQSTTYRYRGKHVGNSSGASIAPMGTFGIGALPGRHLGWSVANLGDFNHDGFEDFLAGAGSPCNTIPGAYYLFSGATGGLLQFVTDPASLGYGQVVQATGNLSASQTPVFMISDPIVGKVYVK